MFTHLKMRLIAVVLLVSSSPVLAQPLADRIPADALVYIGWQGTKSLDGYADSHMRAIIESSDLPKVFSEWVPKLTEALAKEEPEAGKTMQMISAVYGQFLAHPSAFYFSGVDMGDPNNPVPKAALICDAGNDGAAIVASLNATMTKLGLLEAPVKIALHSNRFVTMTPLPDTPAELTVLLTGKPQAVTSLAGKAEFKQAIGQTSVRSAITLYADIEGLLKMAQTIAPNARPNVAEVLKAVGFGQTKNLILTGGFEGKNWSSQWFMAATAGHIPIEKPLSEQLFKVVPKSAFWMSATRFDLKAGLDFLRSLIAVSDPHDAKEFDEGLGMVKMMTGVDLQADLFATLGDEWAMYADPSVGGGAGVLSTVIINRTRDPKKLEEALGKLELFIAKMATTEIQQGGDPAMQLSFRQIKTANANIHYLAFPGIAPAWAIKDGNLYVALYPQVVASAIKASAGPTILENEKYVALRKQLKGAAPTYASFTDLPRTIGPAYSNLMLISRFAQGMSDIFGMDAPPFVIPPLDVLEQHVSIAGSISWADAEGWHGRSLSPFPLGEWLGTEMNGPMIAQPAFLAGIWLPAMSAGHERGNRVKCASNLRQIGQGCALYANDNKGRYPPTLGQLVTNADINPEVFICPNGNTEMPPAEIRNPVNLIKDPAKVVNWVNENSDYVYLGAMLNANSPADMILAYERPENHDEEGINVLFNDGHVDWMVLPEALKLIQQQAPGNNPKKVKGGKL